MNFQFNNLRIALSTCREKSEVAYAFKDICEILYVDGNFESDKYYAIVCETSGGIFGISIEGFRGTTPSLLFKERYLIIGCALKLCFIDLVLKKQICEYDIQPFFEFISSENDSTIIVIHEIGAVAFNAQGMKLWDFEAADIITDWNVSSNRILLGYLEGSNAVVDRQTGKEIHD